ncbi:MAG: hypothetical protein M1828_000582 [Chrysothrix sp. TS-e1954]|nr:MAG: hypothetical protein M1828_000582 [Chrysothrix sp. TS-e1954]
MATANTTATHPYTCNTCLVAFKGSELQRGHMQSDWHRYNLKRRVASLPPLSSSIFTEKVLANQATAAATAARASFERICTACSRTYYSENAYQNHLGSAKHRARLAEMKREETDGAGSVLSSTFSLGTPLDTEARSEEGTLDQVVDGLKKVDVTNGDAPNREAHTGSMPTSNGQAPSTTTEDQTDSPPSTSHCLFCALISQDLEANVHHMQHRHGMFIPERPYLVDLSGLVTWLEERVCVLHECLRCGMIKRTTKGIKTHMRDKGHCMIDFESEEQIVEIGQFYDFTSTYSDDEEDDGDEEMDEARQLGGKREAKVEVLEANVDEDTEEAEDEDWEDDDSNTEDTTNEKTTTKKSKKTAPWEQKAVYHDEDGLHLPSGRTAGHRAFAKYWRQNLRNHPTPEERMSRQAITNGSEDVEMSDDRQVVRGRGQNAVTRANGGLGMLGVSEAKKKEVTALEKADKTRAQRAQDRYQWGNNRRANAQKHFRDPLLQ